MIVIKEFPNKQFSDKEDMYKALREGKKDLINQKKMITKESDSVSFYMVSDKGAVNKADTVSEDVNEITAKLVINTTNILDSHGDVHLKGIWNKSVREQKSLYLLQEHKMKFDHIISDKVKASVKEMTWKDLGADYNGKTEALVFDSTIDKRNEYMFKQYAKGYVKNHSVGMRYVKIDLALNSDNKYDVEEKEVWDKHIENIVNKEQAEQQGYFWAVSEAKIIEGSAVPIGSNTVTPTLDIEAADKSTSETNEPLKDTQKDELKQFLTNIKIN